MSGAPVGATDGPAAATAPASHVVLPGLVEPALVAFLTDYAEVVAGAGGFRDDPQVRGSSSRHGDAAFDTLLARLAPTVSRHVGAPCLPSYSFVRRYGTGQELVPHTDRGACEHSLTVHLAADGDEPWPIWLRHGRDEPVRIVQAPGDALLYRGTEALHWRDPFPGRWHLQLFLHYVAADGPHRQEVLDGRSALGTTRPKRWTS